ncbi:nucleotide exchange factor GrpE [Pengzhenrongella sicca]|uniref:Protein GrpE n=1 Tax=Pengzhenrongella sicca TaxID=2819238 RepID=A0A8A4ZFK7_9MICO|nr:nucleotide exchange factor GrpE [Pengzhenrongella sicca]QTE29326.1 nucleotide exchange factor GrpE [Pengzhenrongella sicca]
MTEHPGTNDGGDGQPDPAADPAAQPAGSQPAGGAEPDPLAGLDFEPGGSDAELLGANALAEELLADLQRVQAEYVNYRKRVERDRTVARDQAVTGVVEALIPVLDDIEAARRHNELDGTPFATIAEKLETTLGRFGWEAYGEVGEVFDPAVHEALMHQHSDDVAEPTVSIVMQVGHRVGGRVVRAARVAVADPDA